MIRRPQRSTLFPSTTLSRSREPPDLRQPARPRRAARGGPPDRPQAGRPPHARDRAGGHTPLPPRPAHDRQPRSEEHTSELQSRQYLVCRLLLEKKKNTIIYF